MKKIISIYFVLLLTIVSCGETEKKDEVNVPCELNQVVCESNTMVKRCVASDNGNIWEEKLCSEGRICESNNDNSVSCNKPNLCDDENCENSQGCTDGGGECKSNTNGKNLCNTNDYMGDCAECLPSVLEVCNDNKLEKCIRGDKEADAHWTLVEDCQNGCNTESNTCN